MYQIINLNKKKDENEVKMKMTWWEDGGKCRNRLLNVIFLENKTWEKEESKNNCESSVLSKAVVRQFVKFNGRSTRSSIDIQQQTNKNT